ncbi:hypothetical protein SKAU_G00381610 [Synaphobranchus kaupii]|uniref:Uncharacterized protein n=1 Tax=Synaphobranchus kaupii TaxID=118154 RepID=A0A9Q1EDV0_SYNKA|nr:hypothetical protein SKAU_G00381610 [Synaphobranchus kaupii]
MTDGRMGLATCRGPLGRPLNCSAARCPFSSEEEGGPGEGPFRRALLAPGPKNVRSSRAPSEASPCAQRSKDSSTAVDPEYCRADRCWAPVVLRSRRLVLQFSLRSEREDLRVPPLQ